MENSNCNHISQVGQINIPTVNSYIYKDECTKCFNNDENGLFVCLSCFNGGCEDRKHALAHSKQTNHHISMYIKKIKTQNEDPLKPPKIEYNDSLKCLSCGMIDKKLLPDYSSTKEIILNATNASDLLLCETSNYGSLRKCPHCLSLKQDLPKEKKDIKTDICRACDKTEGLWICLVCAAASCGRKNFDGSGGNGHGVEHFKETAHPAAVKIGTVSESGEADVFCYICDDSVANPLVLKQLKHLGIREFVKSEKDTKQLELEANRNYDFSKTTEDCNAETLVGKGLTGIKNSGNNCYFSSIVQLLTSLPFMQQTYFEEGRKHCESCRSYSPAKCAHCQLFKVLEGLNSGEYSKLKSNSKTVQEGININMLKSVICKDNAEFLSHHQQDVLEFYIFMMSYFDMLETQRGLIKTTPHFEIELETHIKCGKCERSLYPNEKTNFVSLSMELKGEQSNVGLKEMIEACFSKESMDDYTCQSCKSKDQITRQMKIKMFPEYLMIQIQRFAFNGSEFVKNNALVKTAEHLDLSHFKSEERSDRKITTEQKMSYNEEHVASLMAMGFKREMCIFALNKHKNNFEKSLSDLLENPCMSVQPEDTMSDVKEGKNFTSQYSLVGFITHKGKLINQGHYIAHLKKGDKWVCFDDRKVFTSKAENAGIAYLLLYKAKRVITEE